MSHMLDRVEVLSKFAMITNMIEIMIAHLIDIPSTSMFESLLLLASFSNTTATQVPWDKV